MNRNVFVDNNKKPAGRSDRRAPNNTTRRPAEHRFPGQRSIEEELRMAPASTRADREDIDWEALGIPIPEHLKPGRRRGSKESAPLEPEVLSDELLAREDAGILSLSGRDSEETQNQSPFQILSIDPYFLPPTDSDAFETIQNVVTALGIQKKDDSDGWNVGENWGKSSEGQGYYDAMKEDDSGAGRRQDSPVLQSSRPQSFGMNRRDSGVRRQDFPLHPLDILNNDPYSFNGRAQNSGNQSSRFSAPIDNRRQNSEVRLPSSGVGYTLSEVRLENSEFKRAEVARSKSPGFNGKAQDSGNHGSRFGAPNDIPRQHSEFQDNQQSRRPLSGRRQDSPRRQDIQIRRQDPPPGYHDDKGFRRSSRSPNRDIGLPGRRQESPPPRQSAPRRLGPSGDQGGVRRPEIPHGYQKHHPEEDRRQLQNQQAPNFRQELQNTDHQILSLLKNVLSKLSWTRGLALREIFESAGLKQIFEFMEDRKEGSGKHNENQILVDLKAVLPTLQYLQGVKLKEILEEAGAHEVWRFMNEKSNGNENQVINQQGHKDQFNQDRRRDDQNRFEDRNRQDQRFNAPRQEDRNQYGQDRLDHHQNQMNNRDYDREDQRLKEILETRVHEILRFMNKKANGTENQMNNQQGRQDRRREDQNRFEDRNRQDQHFNDHHQEGRDVFEKLDRLLVSPESRQNQMNNRGYDPKDHRGPNHPAIPFRNGPISPNDYQSQRRRYSPDRRPTSPFRGDPYLPNDRSFQGRRSPSPVRLQDQRQHHGNQHMSPDRRQDNQQTLGNTRIHRRKVARDFDWEGARMCFKQLFARRARLSEIGMHFNNEKLREAIAACDYRDSNGCLEKNVNLLKRMKEKGEDTTKVMMDMLRYEMKNRINNKLCVIWLEAMWRAGI